MILFLVVLGEFIFFICVGIYVYSFFGHVYETVPGPFSFFFRNKAAVALLELEVAI